MIRKRLVLMLVSAAVICLSACGQSVEGIQTQETVAVDEAVEATMEENIEATKNAEPESSIEEAQVSQEIWVPTEAPKVRDEISEEEQRVAELAILEKGTLLFSGDTNQGYYPNDISWLKEAGTDDAIALIYACDDKTHGGWGVLGMAVNRNQEDIMAMSDEPEKERLIVYTMSELLEIAGVANAAELNSFQLGAWNGGRVAGLYYLPQAVATELDDYLKQVDDVEKIIHTYSGELSNENAIDSAKTVYQYLKDTYGKACITGQMESTWMGTPEYEMNYIEENTGKLPAIRGLDFMHNDFAGVVSRAKAWWEKGGIVTICWHTGADFSSAYDESKADDINWDEAFVPGSDTYNALLEGMDRAVPYLQTLEDAGVPVLWRPFHELDGGWFWWSKGGSENFVKLWQLMYSRYTDYWGLDNLIWVFGYSQNGGDMAAWYPGDDYVDLLGADSYTDGPNENLFTECESIRPEGMPVVFHECGKIPTEEEMVSTGAKWLFFMVWHTEWLTESSNGNTVELLNEVYNSDYFITLDELPDFK